MVNENASLIKYEPPKCDECGHNIVVLSDLCAKCADDIELNGKKQANRPGTNPLPTWPKPPAPPNPPPAPTNLLGLLKGAFDWIESAPHGDNCFVSDHYEGDPGNRCNCGKDSLLSAYEEFGQAQPVQLVGPVEPVAIRQRTDLYPNRGKPYAIGDGWRYGEYSESEHKALLEQARLFTGDKAVRAQTTIELLYTHPPAEVVRELMDWLRLAYQAVPRHSTLGLGIEATLAKANDFKAWEACCTHRDAEPAVAVNEHIQWAVSQWNLEVKNRPLVNVHRRSLDDVWRQVIKHFGGNDFDLIGPCHDDLIAAAEAAKGGV